MKQSIFIAGMIALLLGGCQQPAEVELQSTVGTNDLEVNAVVLPDPNVDVASIDSSALLPGDQVKFGGTLIVNQIKVDTGKVVSSFTYSQVLFADSAVQSSTNRFLGHHGMDLGVVRLNATPMLPIPNRITYRLMSGKDTTVVRGVKYLAFPTFQSNKQFVWTLPSFMSSQTVSITSPESLVVVSPRGGTIIPRTKDLEIRWRGSNGRLSVVLSMIDPETNRTRPLLELISKANAGTAVIPAKLLRELPAVWRYVFTFILANRKESVVIPQYDGKILVQVASVYNSYVELR